MPTTLAESAACAEMAERFLLVLASLGIDSMESARHISERR